MLRKMTYGFAAIIAAAVLSATLTGCNTVEGMGEDIEGAGQGISDVSRDTGDALGGGKKQEY